MAEASRVLPQCFKPDKERQQFDGHGGGINIPRIMISDIINLVAAELHLTIAQIVSDARTKDVYAARVLVVYLARRLTPHSASVIGRALGDRDHSTTLHACRNAKKHLATDVKFVEQVTRLEKQLLNDAEPTPDLTASLGPACSPQSPGHAGPSNSAVRA